STNIYSFQNHQESIQLILRDIAKTFRDTATEVAHEESLNNQNWDCETNWVQVKMFHKKGISYEWEPLQEQAFQTLKGHLTLESVLRYPDFGKPFFLYTDASGVDLSVVLAQKDEIKRKYAIVYINKSLPKAKRNYLTTELKYYTVV
ncbi:12207_t:CDS:2, partial [Racocetra fulgida]